MVIYSYFNGNGYVRNSLQALAEADLLAEFWTTFHWRDDAFLARLAPPSLRRQFARRTFPAIAEDKIHTLPWRAAGQMTLGKLPLVPRQVRARWTHTQTGWLGVDAVGTELDKRVASRLRRLPQLRAVYGVEDIAVHTFREAHARRLRTFYDLPIGYWRAGHAILNEEAERQPLWAATLTSANDGPEKLANKDEELALAETVFVATSFTQSTLASYPGKTGNIVLAPYGGPSPHPTEPLPREKGAPLRVLYVGSLGQRKGVSYLLDAVRPLGSRAQLTLVGTRPAGECKPLDDALRAHRWVASLPHGEILAEMRNHDVFVFPSLFEGFGLVILEALAQGTPVITTPHTAGPDVITEGVDGFIVPIRDAPAITERLERLIEEPDLLQEMKRAAWRGAAHRPWESYRRRIADTFRQEITV